MCGITGFFCAKPGQESARREMLGSMVDVMKHRGPDDHGTWFGEGGAVGLGHARLAILDLSPEGHQPMESACKRYLLVYNGEIYNYKELMELLTPKGHSFRGGSDTEVLLAAISQWGTRNTLSRLVGMFAFAVWDRKDQRLTLVRDRLGIKPLYYGTINECFVFASELKALRAIPGWYPTIDRNALAAFMQRGYVPTPYSIYKDIYKLPPGHVLTVSHDRGSFKITLEAFWSAQAVVEAGKTELFGGSTQEAIDQLERLLKDAVSMRMIADVPLGAFLSGGIDSSTVVALMQAQSSRPVRTFSIGFEQQEFNEAPHAAAVARHLGTQHTELYVSKNDMLETVPLLPELYDEPFADESQIPTFLISKLARQDVTVALSGDGGDELFGGYNRHISGEVLSRVVNYLPGLRAKQVGKCIRGINVPTWNTIYSVTEPMIPLRFRFSRPGETLYKLSDLLLSSPHKSAYEVLSSRWQIPENLVLGANEEVCIGEWAGLPTVSLSLCESMMYFDLVSYLTDDVLTKVDRASMAASLEARVPILDHRVVEFAWKLPQHLKLNKRIGKWILRQLLYRYVPQGLIDRPKAGFDVPIGEWLRGPLQEWGSDLLNTERLKREGYLDPQPIKKMWQVHQDGTQNVQYQLWNVLMFQSWQERWM